MRFGKSSVGEKGQSTRIIEAHAHVNRDTIQCPCLVNQMIEQHLPDALALPGGMDHQVKARLLRANRAKRSIADWLLCRDIAGNEAMRSSALAIRLRRRLPRLRLCTIRGI